MKCIVTLRLLPVFLLGLFFSFSIGTAQSYEVKKIDELLGTKKKLSTNKMVSKGQTSLESLVYNVNPSIFIENGNIQAYGEVSPLVAEIDLKDWNILKKNNPLFNSVKLIKFKYGVNDIKNGLDLSLLKDFKQLEFIYIQCTFNCNTSALEQLFQNVNGIKITYLVAITE